MAQKRGKFQLLYGPFAFDSDLEVQELQGGNPAGLLPVRLLLGTVPADLAGLARLDEYCAVSSTQYLLDIPGVARYLVEAGTTVTIERAAEAPPADVRGYLLGSIFGALCHQNGFFPLHASAVRGAAGVTAFLADAGVGKSTTAAFLERRGYPVVADDICLLEPGPQGFRVIPVAGWLKLWRESYEKLGESPVQQNRIFTGADKYRRYLQPGIAEGLTLRHAVFLEPAEDRAEPLLERLPAAAATAGLMRLTYLAYIPELTGSEAEQFRRAAEVLAETEVWRLVMPRGWDVLPAVLDLVEARLLQG